MKKPQTLRDLDAMDSMLDSEFSDDAGVKKGLKTHLRLSILEEKQKMVEHFRSTRGYKVVVVDTANTRYEFNSVAECSEYFKSPVIQGASLAWFPADGSIKLSERRKFKNWAFYRPLLDINYEKEIDQMRQAKIDHCNSKQLEYRKRKAKKAHDFSNSPAGQKRKQQQYANAGNAARKANSKRFVTPDGIFNSQTEAANFYKITKGSMASRQRHNPTLYYYLENK